MAEEKCETENPMKNFVIYECIDERSQNFRGEFDSIEKLEKKFSTYPKFYHHEPPYPHILGIVEDISDPGQKKRIGIFFMAK